MGLFIFKLGELTACLHADGSDSVRGGWAGRIAGVIDRSSNSTGIIEFFTFDLIITKHGHYCIFCSKYTSRQRDVAFLLV